MAAETRCTGRPTNRGEEAMKIEKVETFGTYGWGEGYGPAEVVQA